MRLISLEDHFLMPGVAGLAGRPGLSRSLRERLEDLGERRLAEMDAAGIDFQVVSHTAPGIQALTGEAAVEVAWRANDRLAAAVRRHPRRLGGFAALATSEPTAAAAELRRAREDLGFLGALINGQTQGRFLDDPAFAPILDEAERLSVPIYLHPGVPPAGVREAYFRGFAPDVEWFLAGAAWGWHAETGLHVLRLILAGVFDTRPALRVVVGHLGEMLPFMLARIDEFLPPAVTGLERPVSEYLDTNVLVTTSGMVSAASLACALAVLGNERIMFSVDAPYSSAAAARGLLESAPLGLHERTLIAHATAARLLAL